VERIVLVVSGAQGLGKGRARTVGDLDEAREHRHDGREGSTRRSRRATFLAGGDATSGAEGSGLMGQMGSVEKGHRACAPAEQLGREEAEASFEAASK